jgi:hypothetical protein
MMGQSDKDSRDSMETVHHHAVRETIFQMIHKMDDPEFLLNELAKLSAYSPFHFYQMTV